MVGGGIMKQNKGSLPGVGKERLGLSYDNGTVGKLKKKEFLRKVLFGGPTKKVSEVRE